MVRFAANPPFALVLAAAASLSVGCFDTSSTTTTADYPTLLTVEPQSFRGSLTCGAPGLVRYVVKLTDYTTSGPVDLNFTNAVPCTDAISFTSPPVTIDHYFTGLIEGYDREVTPAVLGEEQMLDSSGTPVAPTWVTTCGEVRIAPSDVDGDVDADLDAAVNLPPYNPLRFPTLALANAEVFLHGCFPLAAVPVPDASADGGSNPADAADEANPSQDAGAGSADATLPEGGGFRR